MQRCVGADAFYFDDLYFFIIRVPVIPEFNGNDYEMQKMANFLKKLKISKVELLPYHAMGEHKWKGIGMQPISFVAPSKEEMERYKMILG